MPIKYKIDYELKKVADEIARMLFPHIKIDKIAVVRSYGSVSRGTIARCHTLGKAMQLGMGMKEGFYVIELISKRFDKLSKKDKIKTVIHELMHIPKAFGGGFKHHDYVNEENVDVEYEKYINLKNSGDQSRLHYF